MKNQMFTILAIIISLFICSFNYNTNDTIIVEMPNLSTFDLSLFDVYDGKDVYIYINHLESGRTSIFYYNKSEPVSYMDHEKYHKYYKTEYGQAINYFHSECGDTTYNHIDQFYYNFNDLFSLNMVTKNLEPLNNMIKNKTKGQIEIDGVLSNDFKEMMIINNKIRNEERIN